MEKYQTFLCKIKSKNHIHTILLNSHSALHCALASHLHKGTRFDDHFDLFLGMQKPKTNKGQHSKYVVYCGQRPSSKVLQWVSCSDEFELEFSSSSEP
jgi:hypothetical protein